MSTPDLDAQVLAPVYAALGVDATYTPPSGAGDPVPVRLMPVQVDQTHRWSGVQVVTDGQVYRVRVAQLPDPVENGTLTIGGAVRVIQGEPVRFGSRRLEWQLDTRPAD